MCSSTLMPPTLLPFSSSDGPNTPMPIRSTSAAAMPPPTPLLAGKPTVMANSPEPSYIPQVSISARMALALSGGISCSPEPGQAPWFASTALICAMSTAVTFTEHIRK